ncbi:MAG: VOC family protein [candidate division Zixibacteria bacterium]|nr:VOC family protein [candidate division Zixibacteria bacterium]
MNGIVFFKTKMLDKLREFYLNEIGCELWLDQGDCLIFKHGNLLLGFCDREEVDRGGIITFFYDSQAFVDRMYEKFEASAEARPIMNEKYRIYNFFARDPEGRQLEFQWFGHEIKKV